MVLVAPAAAPRIGDASLRHERVPDTVAMVGAT